MGLRGFTAGLPAGLPGELSRVTTGLLAELDGRLTPLLDVGLSYLTLDRAGASLSTGERQRIELTSTVRASTTGMLYVLDEPSVRLHPSNVLGLRKTITALAGNGNSVVVVEHERVAGEDVQEEQEHVQHVEEDRRGTQDIGGEPECSSTTSASPTRGSYWWPSSWPSRRRRTPALIMRSCVLAVQALAPDRQVPAGGQP